MKPKPKPTISLEQYAKTHTVARGATCDTCARPFLPDVNRAAAKGVRACVIVGWLLETGAEFSRSSVERHVRDRHWERKAKPLVAKVRA